MRFAISSEDNNGLESTVSQHFGRCPYFTLVDLEDGAIKEITAIDNPYIAEHSPGQIPGYIASLGANVMISGGMGQRANGFFESLGIRTATGAGGTVQEALSSFQDGNLSAGGSCCGQGEGHGHGHDHGGCKDYPESD